MTAEKSKGRVLLPILGVVAVAVALRVTFVDALTKLTGTWMGGVESPRRDSPSSSDIRPGTGSGAA